MDLTADAIRQIQADQTALLQTQNDSMKTDQQAVLLPDGYKIHSLDYLNEKRKFFRAIFATRGLADYTAYLMKQAAPVSIFVDKLKAKCIIDLGDNKNAGGCRHKALLSILERPEYRIFHGKLNSKIGQRELSEFIEDFAEFITLSHDGQTLDLVKSIAAIRKVTIAQSSERTQTEGSLSKSRSALDSIEAKSDGSQLPSSLSFSCSIADGFMIRQFNCRISVLTGRDDVEFIIRPINLESLSNEIEKELGDMLNLIPDASVFYGDINVD